MAKGKKTGGRDFIPGNSGGPGRPPLPDDLKAMRKINRVELELILNRLLNLTEKNLLDLLENDETPSLEKVVASGIVQAIKFGDFVRLSFLLERIVGKVPQQVHTNIPPEFVEAYEKMKDWDDDQLREELRKIGKPLEY